MRRRVLQNTCLARQLHAGHCSRRNATMAGLPLSLVLSDDHHAKHFVCAVCQCLAEDQASITTACSHVFCRACLDEWLRHSAANSPEHRCPTCQTPISARGGVQPLRSGCPLGWRVMASVQVRCPLHEQGCAWTGDYGELQSHLTSSTEHSPGAGNGAGGAHASALAMKEQANAKFSARSFDDALRLYTKAAEVDGSIKEIFCNRAATLLELGQPASALQDCNRALELDPLYAKAYVRKATCLLELGEFRAAVDCLEDACRQLAGNKGSALVERELQRVRTLYERYAEGTTALQEGRPADARPIFTRLLMETHAVSVKLLAAEAELGLGICDRPLRMTLQVLRQNPNNEIAYALRGQAFYLGGNFEDALKLFKASLRLDPDNERAKQGYRHTKMVAQLVEAAEEAAKTREFSAAIERFTTALTEAALPAHAPLFARLHAGRANAKLRIGDYQGCLDDCDIALQAEEDCKDAWLARSNALHALGRHEEALQDMEALMQKWGSSDSVIRHRHERAVFEVRKKRRPNYYEILGVPR